MLVDLLSDQVILTVPTNDCQHNFEISNNLIYFALISINGKHRNIMEEQDKHNSSIKKSDNISTEASTEEKKNSSIKESENISIEASSEEKKKSSIKELENISTEASSEEKKNSSIKESENISTEASTEKKETEPILPIFLCKKSFLQSHYTELITIEYNWEIPHFYEVGKSISKFISPSFPENAQYQIEINVFSSQSELRGLFDWPEKKILKPRQSQRLRFYIRTKAAFVGSCEIFCTKLEKVDSLISTDVVYIEKKRLLGDSEILEHVTPLELHFKFEILYCFSNIYINSLPLFATKDLKSERSILDDYNLNFNDEESLEFIIDGEHYSIIKSILCAGSNYFKYLCSIQEDITNELIIKDRPEAFKQMLSFIVIDLVLQFTDYLEEWVCESRIIPDLLIVADKYDVQNLKFICESLLLKNLAVENASELIELATVSDTKRLRKTVTNFIKSCKEKFVLTKTFLSLRRDRRYKILKMIAESE
ncbi:uncharacterized protein LOC126858770 isoform X2 [Cataglyphis hispanica]|uniref:uncharacterized protein LOC126858770 isoform X2 n=1 Tax=Cataglyphis hispanica TaxID=1086592 RepID=UPI00217FA4CE|nr:uncharacterized protein LOC126858770 isoform X2 [Cataglyphis hispanica]